MTVAELEVRMSSFEVAEWMAELDLRMEDEEHRRRAHELEQSAVAGAKRPISPAARRPAPKG